MGAAILSLVLVAGCGSSGGGGVAPIPEPAPTPSPSPSPSPAPSPGPSPTPSSAFLTSEYNRSDGPAQHGAITAWAAGYSGSGTMIGIVDSGIDTDSPEFAGRIAPSSVDVAGNRGLDNPDSDHGTQVALIAAAARDNQGMVGIAYNSTIAMFRADTLGSCATKVAGDPDTGCKFSDAAIARGVNAAVAAGARIINLSLGGVSPNTEVRSAITNAANAGVVVIVSAGNDGASTDPADDPNNPDPFAAGLRAAGNGNVIIAGSVDANNIISTFSNRAGDQQVWYLAARGERVCCVYENGVMKVTTNSDGSRVVYVVSGTSFAAPQIAGAAALLRQAFPNLTAVQVVELLLRSARDAGAPGTDSVYGRGILDIAAAFSPQGATTLAGSSIAIPLGGSTAVTSSPMGDAGQRPTSVRAIVLDEYQRAYGINLAAGFHTARMQPRLGPALDHETRRVAMASEKLSLAFSVDATGSVARMPWTGQLRLSPEQAVQARVLAARVIAQVAPKSKIAFAFAQGADGLVAQLQGRSQPAFLIAGSPTDDVGFGRDQSFSFAGRHTFDKTGLSFAVEHGSAISAAPVLSGISNLARTRLNPADRITATVDRTFGPVKASLGASWLGERSTYLGAVIHQGFGPGGADSLFLDANSEWNFAPDWHLGAAWRSGLTWARTGSTIAAGSRLRSSAWSLDLGRENLIKPGDSLGLRLSQPLRVESGGLSLNLPVGYSYETLRPTFGNVMVPLVPHGREVDAELLWRGPLYSGSAMVSLFYRRDPGHFAGMPDDKGIAASWAWQF